MPTHATDIETFAMTGIRVLRSGCLDWEDHSHLVDPSHRITIQESSTMRVKCVECQAVNAISAHEGDEGEVGWGCTGCGVMQVIVPHTLDQYVPVDPVASISLADNALEGGEV